MNEVHASTLDIATYGDIPIFSAISIIIIIIIIIIINNEEIRVTMQWITLQGHFTEIVSNVGKNKRNEVQLGKVSVRLTPLSVQCHVFRELRNDRSDGASLTAGGRQFQARAAATGNARSPSVERLVGLTIRVAESFLVGINEIGALVASQHGQIHGGSIKTAGSSMHFVSISHHITQKYTIYRVAQK